MATLRHTQIGPYSVQELIGSGGMADVYRAEKLGPHGFRRQVALKVIRTEKNTDSQFRQMFIEEAKIVQGLSHGNIVALYDFGEIDGVIFIAMEFVESSLARLLDSLEGPLDPCLALYIARCIGRALDHAHTRRDSQGRRMAIIHRDISPHNVLLTADGQVKLADFGIARFAGRCTQTNPGLFKGKIGYLAPEQLSVDPVDHRADIFCLGLVTYEMLTGVNPQQEDQLEASLMRSLTAEIPPLEGFPEDLTRIVMKMVQRSPADRQGSASLVVQQLERLRTTSGDLTGAQDLSALLTKLGLIDAPPPSLDDAFASVLGTEEHRTFSRVTVPDRPERISSAVPVGGRSGKVWLAVTGLIVIMVVLAIAVQWRPGKGELTKGSARELDLGQSAPDLSRRTDGPRELMRSGVADGAVGPGERRVSDAGHTNSSAPADPPQKNSRSGSRVSPIRGQGDLWINLVPWARVTLDGEVVGDTPIKRPVPAGLHTLVLENPHLKLRQERQVQVKVGETLRIEKW